ncbi:MAG: hypothetical protein WCG04_05250 [Alphaproteobacteria bacterium]
MSIQEEETLESLIYAANMHALRIEEALQHIAPILPLQATTLEELKHEDLGSLELITNRFVKLQDLIGAQIFPRILKELREDSPTQSMIDRLNVLEKLEILPSADIWIKMRDQRNKLTHEYPDKLDVMANNLNIAIEHAKYLQSYWITLRAFIMKLISS